MRLTWALLVVQSTSQAFPHGSRTKTCAKGGVLATRDFLAEAHFYWREYAAMECGLATRDLNAMARICSGGMRVATRDFLAVARAAIAPPRPTYSHQWRALLTRHRHPILHFNCVNYNIEVILKIQLLTFTVFKQKSSNNTRFIFN